MAAMLKDVEAQALQLSVRERGELIERLILSLEGPADDTPEAIAQAWGDEIARRVADMEAGRTHWVSAEEVFKEVDEVIATARSRCA